MRDLLIAHVITITFAQGSVYAADMENGRILHEENCVRCHQSEIYTRADRKIKSLEQLKKQVQACEIANELAWFEEEVDDVTEFLNQNYYLFGLK